MKHFIVDIHYTKPFEAVEVVLAAHREFLQTGYDAGLLLFSGPKVPRTGGIIVCRASSLAEAEQFFAQDPFCLADVSTHTITEFDPMQRQKFLDDWI